MKGRVWLFALVVGSALSAEAQAAKPFRWPRMESLETIQVSSVLQADGTPVQLKILRVRQSVPELVQRYADAFYGAGLYMMDGKDQPQLTEEPMLTGLDPRRRITYTVFFQDQGDGTTRLILGEANFALRTEEKLDDIAPLMPGAEASMRSQDEDARVLSYLVKASEAEVQAFYTKALADQGWRPHDEVGVFRRKDETLQMLSQAREDGKRSVVLMLRRAR